MGVTQWGDWAGSEVTAFGDPVGGRLTPFGDVVASAGETPPSPIIPISHLSIQASSGILSLPIYALGDIEYNALRIQVDADTTGCFKLVDVSDPLASPMRIQTGASVTKAIAKES